MSVKCWSLPSFSLWEAKKWKKADKQIVVLLMHRWRRDVPMSDWNLFWVFYMGALLPLGCWVALVLFSSYNPGCWGIFRAQMSRIRTMYRDRIRNDTICMVSQSAYGNVFWMNTFRSLKPYHSILAGAPTMHAGSRAVADLGGISHQ